MGSRKRDQKFIDIEITLRITLREPHGDLAETRDDVKVWLHNRLLNMRGCQAVDIQDVSARPVTIKAEDRGQ